MMPKISIIVPIYNVDKYLEETINSIINQTLKEIEIILVNDGSTDNSGKICDELKKKDNRIKVIHKKNMGVSAARNSGLKIATGEFVGFVDSDDIVCSDMYETLYNNAIENKVDISMVSPVIKELNGNVKYFNNTGKKFIWDREEALKNFFKGNVFNIAVYTKIFKREKYANILFEEEKSVHEDKYYTFQCILNSNRVFFEDVCKYNYIKRENSISTSKFSKRKFDVIYFGEKIYNDIMKINIEKLKEDAYINLYLSKLQILRGIVRNKENRNEFKEEERKLINEIKLFEFKKYKNKLSKQKQLEFMIVQKYTNLYSIVVKIFDTIFK